MGRLRADVGAIVEAVDRKEAHRRAYRVMLAHRRDEFGVGRAIEPAVGHDEAERSQQREIASEPFAADRIEDQIDTAALRCLTHPRRDVLGAVVDRVMRADRQHRAPLHF